jgi:TPP-dependent pyruvate/acetoin dehydrogenase alpha subunit
MNAQELIAFERRMADDWNTGQYPYLVHFSGGNEEPLLDIFKGIRRTDWVLSTHRNHYHYLLKGGKPTYLEDLIRNGRSMFVYDQDLRFFTSSIVAGNCCIGVGIAQGIKLRGKEDQEHVWCFVGDAAEDQGHFYEAVMFSHGFALPITFIIEDNDRNVETSRLDRRGMNNPPPWPANVIRYHYKPTYPHAGSGTKEKITFANVPNPWS